ncbi:RCC1/BLIP-II protein [Rhodotorula sp. JG-1b]|nr:RCC1/BLIP-II protein [Rhodotorula sp. JG-1b]
MAATKTATDEQPARRRSSRASIVPPPRSAPKNPVVPNKKKNKATSTAAAADSDSDLSEQESDSDDEEQEQQTGRKRKARSSVAAAAGKKHGGKKVVVAAGAEGKPNAVTKKATAKATREIKPKPRRAPISGLNPLPTLFSLFPSHSLLTLPSSAEPEPVPTPTEAPRTIFVFGTGDMGQNGLGVDDPKALDEIKRPRKHIGFADKVMRRQLGWEGGVADLVCGGMHTLAIDGQGKVWSWGINDNAALGRVTNKPGVTSEELEATPMQVEHLDDAGGEPFRAVRVAAGDSVSLAISDRGELRAWGSFRAAEGLLGFDGSAGSSKTQLVPQALRNVDKHTIVQVACGDDHFLALTSTGMVFACGNGEQSQLGHKEHGLTPERLALKNIVLVGTGSYHSFAVDKDGQVFAWGLNSFHQTGVDEDDGGREEVISTPTRVAALSPSNLPGGARVVEICGGAHHTLFLLSNGDVYVCGRSDGHEIGLGDDHPEMVASRERKDEAKAARAEREKHELASMHGGEDGQITATNEDGSRTLSEQEVALVAAENAARAIPLPNDYVPLPTRLAFPKEPKAWQKDARADDLEDDDDVSTEETKIVQIAAGTRHNFAVSARGYVYSWGVGPSSQLGHGDEEEVETPTRILNTALSNVRVLRAETGGQHSVLVGIDREYKAKAVEREQQRKAAAEAAAAAEQKEEEEEKAAKPNGDAAEVDTTMENGESKDEKAADGEDVAAGEA